MKKTIFRTYILTLILLTASYSLGEIPYSGRYYKDQSVETVNIRDNLREGVLVDGRLILTEQEAVAMALANNLDINVSRHQKLSSYWDTALQKAAYDPVGAFKYDWHKTTKAASSLLEGGDKLTDTMGTYSLSYTQPFRTGTNLDITFIGVRNATSNFFAGYNPSINTHLQAIVSQDILKGFLKSQPEYEIEVSLNNSRLSDEAFREQASSIIMQVQESYWNLAAARQVVDSNRKALELAETVHKQNLIRLEVGTGSELEAIQSQAEVSSRQEGLITAEYTYRNAQDALAKLISNHEDPRSLKADIVPKGLEEMLQPESESFENLLETASANRPEMKEQELNIRNLEIRLDQARDELKPSLTVSGGYEQFGLGGVQIIRDFSQGFMNPPIIAINEGGLGDSLSEMFSGDYRGYVLGFDLRFPIKNSAAKARNAQAQIALNKAQMEKQSLRQAIALEIRDALTQMEMNKARITASDATVLAAEKRLEGEEARFEVGVGTTRELIEAQRDLLQAISTQVEARTGLAISRAKLDKAVGRTFSRHGVVLKEEIKRNVG